MSNRCAPWKWKDLGNDIYFPHIGNTEWTEKFFQKQIINVDEKSRVITIMWQGPWKLRYHAPLGVGIIDEYDMKEIGITFGGAVLNEVFEFIKNEWIEPIEIHIDDLSYISDDYFPFIEKTEGADKDRYEWADLSYPLTVVSGLKNHDDKKYRIIDGRRRLHKLVNKHKKSTAMCNVITIEQFEKLAYKYEVISYEQSKRSTR